MQHNKLIDEFLLNLENEFFNNSNLWNRSLAVANSVVDAMNEKYNSNLNHINYDAFCIHAREFACDFMTTIDLEQIFLVSTEEVLTFASGLGKLSGEEFDKAYLNAAQSLHQTKILNLQLRFHRHCIEKCLLTRAPEEFQRFNIILETLWDLQDNLSMQ